MVHGRRCLLYLESGEPDGLFAAFPKNENHPDYVRLQFPVIIIIVATKRGKPLPSFASSCRHLSWPPPYRREVSYPRASETHIFSGLLQTSLPNRSSPATTSGKKAIVRLALHEHRTMRYCGLVNKRVDIPITCDVTPAQRMTANTSTMVHRASGFPCRQAIP